MVDINIDYIDNVCIYFQLDISIFLEIITNLVSFVVSYDSIIVANQWPNVYESVFIAHKHIPGVKEKVLSFLFEVPKFILSILFIFFKEIAVGLTCERADFEWTVKYGVVYAIIYHYHHHLLWGGWHRRARDHIVINLASFRTDLICEFSAMTFHEVQQITKAAVLNQDPELPCSIRLRWHMYNTQK